MAHPTGSSRLLTAHFLRRFLDNDLISPHADRHETLTVAATALVSSGLFLTVLLSFKYLLAAFPTPSMLALVLLDDMYFWCMGSLSVMALVVLSQWEALDLERRDGAILGTLPVPSHALARAKLLALVLFGAAFGLLLNVAPSILFPMFSTTRLPLSLANILAIIGSQLAATLAAGAFGFLAIVAVKQTLRALLGARLFGRCSMVVQAALVVTFVALILSLPATASGVARWGYTSGLSPYAVPALWFVGLRESLAGNVLDGAPTPDDFPPRILREEDAATRVYHGLRQRFHDDATRAMTALAFVTVVALAGFQWNNRRLPVLSSPPRARAVWLRRRSSALIRRFIVPHQVSQAGFFFTLQVLQRSPTHRLVMATALALGLAGGLAASLSGIDWHSLIGAGPARAPLSLWAIQPLLLAMLLAGLRHAARVPAELRAQWLFHLAWPGDDGRFIAGVKRAALCAVVAPVLVALVWFHAMVLGLDLAVWRVVVGGLVAGTLLEALFLGMRQPPFLYSYAASAHFKLSAPIYVVGGALLCNGFGWLERFAAADRWTAAGLIVVLIVVLIYLRIRDSQLRRHAVPMPVEEPQANLATSLDLTS